MIGRILICALFTSFALAQTYHASFEVTYDGFGNLDRLVFPPYKNGMSGSVVTFEYESEMQIPTKGHYKIGTANEVAETETFLRNVVFSETGKPKQALAQQDVAINWLYDDLQRLNQHKIHQNGLTHYHLGTAGIQYGEFGNIVSYRLSSMGQEYPVNFTYTDQGSLSSMEMDHSQVEYQYDKFGNLTNSTELSANNLYMAPRNLGSYDHQNQPESANIHYDALGRLVGDGERTYHYRQDLRLGSIKNKKGWVEASFKYDADGIRVAQLEHDLTTVTMTGGTSPIYETAYRDGVQRARTERIASAGFNFMNHYSGDEVVSNRRSYEYQDYLGSTVHSMVDSDQVERIVYSPFGVQIHETGALKTGLNGFTGHQNDSPEWTYMKARYYSNALARFTSPDPVRDMDTAMPASMNLYQYARNNPVNMIDPTGFKSEEDDDEGDGDDEGTDGDGGQDSDWDAMPADFTVYPFPGIVRTDDWAFDWSQRNAHEQFVRYQRTWSDARWKAYYDNTPWYFRGWTDPLESFIYGWGNGLIGTQSGVVSLFGAAIINSELEEMGFKNLDSAIFRDAAVKRNPLSNGAGQVFALIHQLLIAKGMAKIPPSKPTPPTTLTPMLSKAEELANLKRIEAAEAGLREVVEHMARNFRKGYH